MLSGVAFNCERNLTRFDVLGEWCREVAVGTVSLLRKFLEPILAHGIPVAGRFIARVEEKKRVMVCGCSG